MLSLGNLSAYTIIEDPLGLHGTYLQGIWGNSIWGNSIVGDFTDANGTGHGFAATPIPRSAITRSGDNLTISWPYNENQMMM